MSKAIKQLQMNAMKEAFNGVSNLVVLSASGLSATAENNLRLALRKKNIRLQMVKNSLAKRVFSDLGLQLNEVWGGSTVFAWGPESVKELSKELQDVFRTHEKKDPKFSEKVRIKTAVAEGTPLPFARALEMPTRIEAIGEIVAMVLGPGSQLAAVLSSPGAMVASQVATIADKKPESEPAPAA